jgi:phosphate transport system permease protein
VNKAERQKNSELFAANSQWRHRKDRWFRRLAQAATWFGVVILAVLIIGILKDGLGGLSLSFLDSFPSRKPEIAGFKAAIWGSLWAVSLTGILSMPLGVAAAVYLEEYAKKGRLVSLLDLLIANLAGVPSILYGMLGLIAFVRVFGMDELSFLGLRMPFGRSVIAGSLTLTLLILPVIIIATREALRAVPSSLRQAAFGLGATQWQCVRHHVLPAAVPGMLTGVVLALSRALGETAPLIMIGALTYVAFVPETPYDPFTAMPIQIFNWASRPQSDFHDLAATGCIVLLVILLGMNGFAVWLRNRAESRMP